MSAASLPDFIARRAASASSERASKDLFFIEVREMTLGDRTKGIERVVAVRPDLLEKFQMAGDVIEEIPPEGI